MLFISRYIGLDEFGVVDTDDGVEQVVTKQNLLEATYCGIEIHGYVYGSSSRRPGDFFVMDITPWQDEHSLTKLQIKTHMIRKIRVIMWNGMIANILWEPAEVKEPVTLRLSDFGNIVADRVLFGNAPVAAHKLTLILDDKLELLDNAFLKPNLSLGLDGLGVVFDLREVTSEKLIQRVYSQLFRKAYDLSMDSSIIDDESRKHMIVTHIMSRC